MKIKLATIGVLVMLQVTAWASTETVVGISSDLETGMAPTGNRIVDSSGNFYGVTLLGGNPQQGDGFRVLPQWQRRLN
jgi:hypothetical protein